MKYKCILHVELKILIVVLLAKVYLFVFGIDFLNVISPITFTSCLYAGWKEQTNVYVRLVVLIWNRLVNLNHKTKRNDHTFIVKMTMCLKTG